MNGQKIIIELKHIVRLGVVLFSFLGSCGVSSFHLFREEVGFYRGSSGLKRELTPPRSQPHNNMSTKTNHPMQWTPLKPSNFPTPVVGNRKFAKDENYLAAIQEVWKVRESDYAVETSPFVYLDNTDHTSFDHTPLYGHLIRRVKNNNNNNKNEEFSSTSSVPGILLFHTAAGPQDVFLFYKSYQICQELDCVVLICDILSDETGWGWDPDRSKYNQIYKSLLANEMSSLRSRSVAAIESLLCGTQTKTKKQTQQQQVQQQEQDPPLHFGVDPHRIAAIGWCLGGKPILALGTDLRAAEKVKITVMTTFHGVFGPPPPASRSQVNNNNESDHSKEGNAAAAAEIYIFNGADDPFVSQLDLDSAKERLHAFGHTVNIFQMQGARHGFSNPAQIYNDNPSFNYVESAAIKGWDETIALLHRRLLDKK